MRGIFCLADFHLQSGDVTFVCGNEIARQQTVGYIILLLSFPFLSSFICGFFLTLFISPWDIKKPVSQDQLVTSRDLGSEEGCEETKAAAVSAPQRGDEASWLTLQAINVTSGARVRKADLTIAQCPAATWGKLSKEHWRSLTYFLLTFHLSLSPADFSLFSSTCSSWNLSSKVLPFLIFPHLFFLIFGWSSCL